MGLLGETAAFTTALFLMLVGLVGVVLPVVPGLILIWLGALGFAVVEQFARIDPITFVFLTLLAISGISADVWMTRLGAQMGGASTRAQLMGTLTGIVGAALFFVFGGISAGLGALLGSVVGVFGYEYLRTRAWGPALKSGAGWLVGWLASTLVQLIIGGGMIVIFLWQAFKG